jgi:tetratricopeptide (TPR) repeat protein
LAQAAQEGPWALSPLMRAEVAQQEARGLAMTGESRDLVARKLDEAWQLYSEAGAADPDQLGWHYSENLLLLQTAICHCEAGEPLRAIEIYNSLLGNDHFTYRDQGYFRSLMAGALAVAGEVDQATQSGVAALEVAQQISSRRTLRELKRVVVLLEP